MSDVKAKSGDSAGENRVLVYLRVRPPNDQENQWFNEGKYKRILKDESMTPNPEQNIVIAKSNKTHHYDNIFGENAKQANLFQKAAVPTLENVFDGYCGAVLAYGQTGTGKTFTMQGYAKDYGKGAEGIIPRSAHYIFQRIAKDTANTYKVTVSFVEIYLDKLKDLFQPDAPEVSINHEPERVELMGVTELGVNSEEEMMKLFHQGERKRVTRATKMNPTSSRGHAALIVNVHQVPKDESQGTKVGKLVLVDLAGYERFEQTGVTTGVAAQEARTINASLLALGGVVNALAEQSKSKHKVHVPYRNAKLTRLLKDCLGGTSKSATILTIGPCDKYQQETAGTLFFGSRAMDVAVHATAKSIFDPTAYTASLKSKLDSAIKVTQSMVNWWSRSHPNDYKNYCQKYGEPDCAEMEGEEEEELLSALQRNETEASVIATHRQSIGADGPSGSVMNIQNAIAQQQSSPCVGGASVVAASVDSHTMLPNRMSAPVTEVEEVRQQWHLEKRLNEEQQNREEHALLANQWEELELLKKSGADKQTIANLKRDQAQERQFMAEQRQEMQAHLEEEQQKAEVVAMMNAMKTKLQLSSTGSKKEERRVSELSEHLGATCSNKDEVMTQLFEYIYQLEREVATSSENLPAIEQMIREEATQHSQQANKAFARQIEELKTENLLLKEKVAHKTVQKSTKTPPRPTTQGHERTPPHHDEQMLLKDVMHSQSTPNGKLNPNNAANAQTTSTPPVHAGVIERESKRRHLFGHRH